MQTWVRPIAAVYGNYELELERRAMFAIFLNIIYSKVFDDLFHGFITMAYS